MGREATITVTEGLYLHLTAIPQDAPISPRARSLLDVIAQLCKKNAPPEPTAPVTLNRSEIIDGLSSLIGKPISATNAANLFSRLKALGVFQASPGEEGKLRQRHLHLTSVAPLLKGPKTELTKTRTVMADILGTKNSMARSSGALTASNYEMKFALQDMFINGIFDGAMSMNKDKSITSMVDTIQFAGKPLVINSASAYGSLMRLSDQRLVRPLLAFCQISLSERRKSIERSTNKQIPNRFMISDFELCNLIGLPVKKVNRLAVTEIFKRIANTIFRIDSSLNPTFQKMVRFDNSFVDWKDIQMQVISSFDEGADTDAQGVFSFSLDERLFMTMLLVKSNKQNLFKAPLSLAKDSSGVIHALFNWVRRTAKKGDSEALWGDNALSIPDIHAAVLPNTTLTYFSANLKSGLAKGLQYEDEVSASYLIHAIEIKVDKTSFRHKFQFRIDLNDQVIGPAAINLAKIKKAESEQQQKQRSQLSVGAVIDSKALLSTFEPSSETLKALLANGFDKRLLPQRVAAFIKFYSSLASLPANLDEKFLIYENNRLSMSEARKLNSNQHSAAGARSIRDLPISEQLGDHSWAESLPNQGADTREEHNSQTVIEGEAEVVDG